MIEIFVLIFLTRKIGALAAQKGQKPGRWKLYTVFTWFGFEVVGLMVGMIISQNILLALLLALASAFGGYLLMKFQLEKIPDIDSDWESRIGKADDAR